MENNLNEKANLRQKGTLALVVEEPIMNRFDILASLEEGDRTHDGGTTTLINEKDKHPQIMEQ